jgi:hypothetical protein
MMENFKSYYSEYDVMNEKEHWDPHTTEIVEKRLKSNELSVLKQDEACTLFELCSALLDDKRGPIISYVTYNFDSKLKSDIGEAQRKKNVPKEMQLIRNGLQLLDTHCHEHYKLGFCHLEDQLRKDLIGQMINGSLNLKDQAEFPTKEFILKILDVAASAYYSHPTVWSEIGYGGPAYPRGYVRSELGLTDPWEAKQNES